MQAAAEIQQSDILEHLNVRNDRILSLAQCAPGQVALIQKIGLCDPELKAKLCSMGLCPGHEVKILYRAPLGDPITIQVLNSQLALRVSEATPIVVALKA